MAKKKTPKARAANIEQVVSDGGESLPRPVEGLDEVPPGIAVSMFDCSVENHFKALDLISKICGEECEFDESEIERLRSSITFLREWIHFNYQPKIVRFTCQSESLQGKTVSCGINLPQFSAATVPKKDRQNGTTKSPESRSCCSKDFIMHVGGSVWALDWCPRVHQSSDSDITSEFLAVAAHPPDSSYHKMGAPLIGRGVVQIWCLVSVVAKEEGTKVNKKPKRSRRYSFEKPRGRPRKNPIIESVDNLDSNNQNMLALAVQLPDDSSKLVSNEEAVAKKGTGRKRKSATKDKSTQPKKPRGRPRKKPINESIDELDPNNQCEPALAVQFTEDSSKLLSIEPGNSESTKDGSTQPKKPRGRARKKPIIESVDEVDSDNQYELTLAVQFPEDSSKLLSVEPGNSEATKDGSTQPKKPRGRARKKPINNSVDELDSNNQCEQALAVQLPEDSSKLLSVEPGNSEATKDKSTQPQKSRGRPRKKPINESVDDLDFNDEFVQALAVQFPEDSSKSLPIDAISNDTYEHSVEGGSHIKQKGSSPGVKTRGHVHGNVVLSSAENENNESTFVNPKISSSCNQDPMGSSLNIANDGSLETNLAKCSIPKDVALPRAVLCLAHNGKVAWDVKWRPCDVCDTGSKHRMGFLAVLLGNGALEVWEVPSPRALKVIYSACQKEGTDPRFIKLEPVFRCSMIKSGDRRSIPLTVEWSASSPHDLILAGCHDGVVALWKFTDNRSSKDTRPLLCFSADTVPIRALAWAPVPSDPENANVFVTAGHKGLKFWDMRDPSRPLWELNPTQRVIYSLDWLPDPRCIIISFDDGTLRILSMLKAANDGPVTGKPFAGTAYQGLHSYYCSPFTIWSVQVSRLTGMVAYCGADGTALRFQLTIRAVEKDPIRNRAPHFLCGSLTEEDSTLTVNTPLPDTPFPMKKSTNEWSNAPRSIRGFVSVSNQEKRAKEEQMAKAQVSDEHALAVCCGDDGSEDTVVTQKKKLKKGDQELVCIDEEEDQQKEDSEKGEVERELDVFPPKMVAMHRVRWNLNKGSERWLCFGGAAGIVRCQEIGESDLR